MTFKRTTVDCRNNVLKLFWGMKRLKFGKIGEKVRICPDGCFWGNSKKIFIEDNVFIAGENYFDAISEIHIGEGTMIGPRCVFIGGAHNYNSSDLMSVPYDNVMIDRPIVIEKNVWIAANVTVCPGCHIGEGCVIGAGACIYGDIPAYSIVVSSGYRIVKKRNIEKYQELKEKDKIYNKCFAGTKFRLRKG